MRINNDDKNNDDNNDNALVSKAFCKFTKMN